MRGKRRAGASPRRTLKTAILNRSAWNGSQQSDWKYSVNGVPFTGLSDETGSCVLDHLELGGEAFCEAGGEIVAMLELGCEDLMNEGLIIGRQ